MMWSPRRDYPRALLISVGVILTTLILGSLAVALVIPAQQLNLAGVMQAFGVFLSAFGLSDYQVVLAVWVVIGGLGAVAAWILGPGRCLLVASREAWAHDYLI